MLKHKRVAKCPFLQEFIVKCVALAEETSFVPSEEIFQEYCRVVSLWTEEDSECARANPVSHENGKILQGKY